MTITERAATLPRLTVQMEGEDGKAFAILGRVSRACKQAGWPANAREELISEMTSGDYDHLLRTVLQVTGYYEGGR